MIVEFTVQQGLEKLCVLASAIHLLCFSPTIMLFCCLCTTVAMIIVAEQEAEVSSPSSHMAKHWFSEPLGICKPHEQNAQPSCLRYEIMSLLQDFGDGGGLLVYLP